VTEGWRGSGGGGGQPEAVKSVGVVRPPPATWLEVLRNRDAAAAYAATAVAAFGLWVPTVYLVRLAQDRGHEVHPAPRRRPPARPPLRERARGRLCVDAVEVGRWGGTQRSAGPTRRPPARPRAERAARRVAAQGPPATMLVSYLGIGGLALRVPTTYLADLLGQRRVVAALLYVYGAICIAARWLADSYAGLVFLAVMSGWLVGRFCPRPCTRPAPRTRAPGPARGAADTQPRAASSPPLFSY